MAQFEVTITYRVEYTAVKYVRAKDEETAQARVEAVFEERPPASLADFETYIGKDSEIQVEETIEIDTISEA
jgi:hypothetical protein